MKMLVICLEDDKDRLDRLGFLLEKMPVPFETLLVNSQDGGRRNIEKQFFAFFKFPTIGTDADSSSVDLQEPDTANDSPSHVIILSDLAPEWTDFIAGFSCGSHVPFLVYGKEAIAGIPDVFNFCFKFLETEDSLSSYLNSESEAFHRMETDRKTQKARNALLKQGIPVNNNSLAQCVAEGLADEIKLFFAAGFTPDTRDKTGVPLLNIAARTGNVDIAKYLIAQGAGVNLQAEDRDTSALIDSVMGKFPDIMMELIKAGADMDIQSKDGQTALIVAIGADEVDIVEELMKAGANPDIADRMGMSARKYASLFRKTAITGIINNYAPEKAAQP